MRINVTSVFVDTQDKALRFDDSCGNLLQIAAVRR
jgi:hypothetical protein